jgi:hypothetical protein
MDFPGRGMFIIPSSSHKRRPPVDVVPARRRLDKSRRTRSILYFVSTSLTDTVFVALFMEQ